MTALHDAEWRFAPTGGGILYGYNNAGTEHFKQDPIGKLIRETIQNSLDAHEDGLPQVIVDINECDIAAADIGAASLQRHLQQALAQTASKGQEEGQQDYRNALRLVSKSTIPCLAIIDRNTTGLQGRKWDSLIYEEGAPEKDGPGAPGGSFGIGKNACYNVAGLHAVIYSTSYTNGKQGWVAKKTGRAQLVSHPDPDDAERMLQHIGFYAHQDRQPISGPDIPEPFRLKSPGTGLWIAGFAPAGARWHEAAMRATVDNFFHAIHNRRLVVNILPESASEPVVICHDTIDSILEAGKGSPRTTHYYRAIRKNPSGATEPCGAVGALDVHINNAKGAPRRVAYVNRRGMLITDTRERRRSNPFHPGSGQGSWPDYAAVVVAADDATDKYIRRMENPSHDIIAVERLPAGEQEAARQQLNNASAQIRDIIDQAVREQDAADISNLTELAEMFPDLDTSLPGNRELNARVIAPRPQPHRVATTDDSSDRNADAEAAGYDLHADESSGDAAEGGDNSGDHQGGSGGGNGHGGHGGAAGARDGKNAGRKAQATRHAIKEMVIMRTGPGQLAVALSPDARLGSKVSFTIEHGGEVRWQESRLPITSISHIQPTTAKAEHSDDIVTVTLPKGHKGPVTLTLDTDGDAAYTGLGFSERQAPDDAKTGAERLEQIRQLLTDNLTQSEIARQTGISRQRVSRLVRKHSLKGGQPS